MSPSMTGFLLFFATVGRRCRVRQLPSMTYKTDAEENLPCAVGDAVNVADRGVPPPLPDSPPPVWRAREVGAEVATGRGREDRCARYASAASAASATVSTSMSRRQRWWSSGQCRRKHGEHQRSV